MSKKGKKHKAKKKKVGPEFPGIRSVLKGAFQPSKNPQPKPSSSNDELSKREEDLLKLIADITTGLWRIKNKFSSIDKDQLPDEMQKANRHLQSTWDALTTCKVEVSDHTGEKFPQGNPALKIIASQPTPSVQYEVITETIKPTIYYNGRLIQMGQVIVEKPQSTESNEKLSNANANSDTSSKQNDKNSAKRSGEKTAKTKNEKELDKNKEGNTK